MRRASLTRTRSVLTALLLGTLTTLLSTASVFADGSGTPFPK